MTQAQEHSHTSSSVRFYGVPSDKIDAVWPHVQLLVSNACLMSRGRYQSDDIKVFCKEKKTQLWIATENGLPLAVFVTEIINYPRKKYARVMITTGKDREKWIDLMRDEIEGFAKSQGADGVESLTREGWARVFKDYEKTHVLLEKEF